ncbi:hypothetical protein [Vitiosangium sp. GDMCC 1.1324]|uniref:hypothetical protein n=1 Tax=Vitiosangium sp. (strain GDMCC 1.1324) TaxID=2138576 RepID=UPI000D3816D2|nr:hypothetical protein [Vitiosangium sp. GDMCC 1.1324]PTL81366.1 hypothetical protein DAT35_24990 [Vitiosangium sp. GDMCC 1.1324]
MRFRILGVVLLGLLSGCSTSGRLLPTPAPEVVVSTDGRIAAIASNGVRLVASADTWKGNPSDLENALTPVELILENTSGRNLRVEYADFALVGEARYAAIQPQSLSRPATSAHVPVAPPSYSPYGHLSRESQPTCLTCSAGLPTADMLRLAFPEGLLKDESSWSGFLYFQLLGAHERQVTLQARLVDASTGEAFGTLRIPFHVRGSSR